VPYRVVSLSTPRRHFCQHNGNEKSHKHKMCVLRYETITVCSSESVNSVRKRKRMALFSTQRLLW
jgi:hypothetical protein